MLKLLRCSHLALRLCESKQCINFPIFNMEYNKLLTSFNRPWITYYSTQHLENINGNDNNESTQKSEYPNIQEITGGDPDLEQKLKVIILEAEVMRQEGRNTPSISFLKKSHWEELLKLSTRTARKRYLSFLFKLEMKKENFLAKKEQKRLEWKNSEKPDLNTDDGRIIYSLQHNNIFLRFYDTTINHFYNNKLIEAIKFGQQLVVDCGYDKNMNTRENVNAAKQLMFLFSDNRAHDEPYDLHFCNLNKDSTLEKALRKQINTMYEPWFPLNIHEKSYCDIFPKNKLIYLTPHCREEMIDYDHDAVYIIGAIVDRVNNEPLSMAKAKREGLKMMKLPLDRYLQWGSGSGKSLTLNHVVSILLDVKKTGDWSYALRHVPKRKLEQRENVSYPSLNKARTLSYDSEENDRHKFRRDTRYNGGIQRDRNKTSTRNTFQVKSILNDHD